MTVLLAVWAPTSIRNRVKINVARLGQHGPNGMHVRKRAAWVDRLVHAAVCMAWHVLVARKSSPPVAPVAGWNGQHGRDVQLLVWAVNGPDHVIVITLPKLVNNVLAVRWRPRNALLVSVKYGPVGKPGQHVLATLAKCAVMDHVLVSVLVLVSLANQVAAGTQSKRAHAL